MACRLRLSAGLMPPFPLIFTTKVALGTKTTPTPLAGDLFPLVSVA
jgi:hypothetical protein